MEELDSADIFKMTDVTEITLTKKWTHDTELAPNLGRSVPKPPDVKIETTTNQGAIHSIDYDFAPWLDGKELLKYYEERTLTNEQVRAMVKSENEKVLNVPISVKETFLKSGVINRDCPKHETLMKIMAKLYPEMEPLPIERLCERLHKDAKPDKRLPKKKRPKNIFFFKINYLWQDEVCTYITQRSIEQAWVGLAKLVGCKEAIKGLSVAIHERLSQDEL